jgi:hypothetical protein
MREKTRSEIVLLALLGKGTRQEKDSAWRYLRSVSARAEADIVNASRLSQNEIADLVSKMKASDVKTYNTGAFSSKVNAVLSRLVSDCEVIARRLVIANVLSGKLKSVISVQLELTKLTESVSLVDSDYTRIDKMVSDIVVGIRRGASLSASSVMAFVNRMSLKANMPAPISQLKQKPLVKVDKLALATSKKDKDKKDNKKKIAVVVVPKKEQIKQSPLSKDLTGERLEIVKPKKVYIERVPSAIELKSIKANPSAFIGKSIRENVGYVNTLRAEYRKEIRQMNDKKEKDKAISVIKKGKDAHAREVIFEASNDLRANGLFAFVDKGGKRWTLMNYCSMMARTVSTQSTNIGDLYADSEHDLYYIVPHSHSCPICHKVEGKVYSRSGTSKKYPPLASVFPKIDPNGTDDLSNRYFSIHPNCRHVIVKYIEKGAKK